MRNVNVRLVDWPAQWERAIPSTQFEVLSRRGSIASRGASFGDGPALGAAKFCHVLPRGMRYSRTSATSIDLFVSELVEHSQQANAVIAERTIDPLPAPLLIQMPSYGFAKTLRRARFIAGKVAQLAPDVVIVQQHIPSAVQINTKIKQPVVLQRHNFVEKPEEASLYGSYNYRIKVDRLNKLAGITFVSDTVLRHFERNWPDVHVPRTVICNGFASDRWHSQLIRDNTILVVGRVAPEKGILEAADAVLVALSKAPGWRARFILSEENVHPAYFERVQRAIALLGDRASVQLNVPFESVKVEFERAAVALVPSKWAEPFGRTCLEAHAGGAAVISSGTGGLKSISGHFALYVDPDDPRSIANALDSLIADSALRARLARNGNERVRRLFGLEAIAAKLDSFCLSLAVRGRV